MAERLTTKNYNPCSKCIVELYCDKNCKDKQIYNKLKHYEDLEEQGRLVILQKPIGRVTFDQFNREGGTHDTSTND